MADGSITFSTELDNKELEDQLADLRHEIEGAEKDLGSSKDLGLTKSIEAAKEAAGALAKELALIPSEFAPGYDKDAMQFMEDYAKNFGKTAEEANELKAAISSAKAEVEALENQGKWFGDEEYDAAIQKLNRINADLTQYKRELISEPKPVNPFGMDTLAGKVKEAELALERLKAAGKGLGTDEYDKAYRNLALLKDEAKSYAAELAKTPAQAAKEAAAIEAAAQKQAALDAKKAAALEAEAQKQSALEEKTRLANEEAARLAKTREQAVVSDQRIVDLNTELVNLQERLAYLKKAGLTAGYEEYDQTASRIAEIKQEIASVSSHTDAMARAKEYMSRAISAIGAWVQAASAAFIKFGKTAIGAIGGVAGKILSTVGEMNVFSKLADSLSGKMKRLGGMISRAFVFTVVQKGLRGLRDRIGEYLSVDKELMASLKRMNGALATAFQPIFQAVLPALRALVDLVTRAAAAIATLTASMFGQTQKQAASSAKALSSEADALGATGKAAKDASKSMAGFDEINQLSNNSSSDGSGGGSASEAADFSGLDNATVFDSWGEAFSSFLDNVLSGMPALNEALDGFARRLNNFSQNLLDAFTFPGVQEKVSRIGTELAQALNQMVTTIDWPTLGAALGAGLNTALSFLVSFLYTFDWMGLGSSLADLVNGALKQINWTNFGKLLWSGWKIAIETLAGFLLKLDMKDLAKAASDTAIGFFNSMTETIQKIDWKKIGEQVRDFLVNVDWPGVATSVFEAIGSAFGAATAFLWGLIEDAWQEVVDWWHDKAFEDGQFTLQGLLDGIVEVVKNIGAWIKENIFDPFIDGFKTVFGIHSPSTVMAEQGGFIMEGLQNGISDLVDNVLAPFRTIRDRAKEILNGIITFITGTFKEDWQTAWDGVKDVFKGVWNGIVTLLESAVNIIIGGVNWLISKLNTISFDIPDWVPKIGGNSFGISIPAISEVRIPRLATGAVIPPNREFMAILGDQKSGTNIEAPESLLRQIAREETGAANAEVVGLLNRIATLVAAGKVMEVDKVPFAKVVYSTYNGENRRHGISLVTR